MTENKENPETTEIKKSWFYLFPLGLALCVCGGLWLGSNLSGKSGVDPGTETARYQKIKDIIHILDAKYVDSVNSEQIFESAIGDMLHQLDPHSNYIPAKDLQAVNESISGEFFGIGIRFFVIRDTLCVTNVIEASPSEAAGLKAGDKIVAIENTSIAGKSIDTDDIMKKLKGPEGTKVQVTIWRQGKKIPKTIVRGGIPIESVSVYHMLDREVGYIKIDQFSINTAGEFRKAAAELLRKGMKKLILDLRDNGGGVLGTAVAVCDEFLEGGLDIVSIKGEHMKTEKSVSTSRGMLKNMETVVLINSNSASASEIVAGALQDNDRATIMGRRSFGKGLVQEDFLLRDGSNLRLTIARYYTPTGRCIQKPYNGSMEDYYGDQLKRFDNGELYAPDTSLFVDSLKFKTPGGRTVYGGGGIMPDIFVAYDSLGLSSYFTQLRYNSAFQVYAFDYVQNKRTKWRNVEEFNRSFQVDDNLFQHFVNFAQRELKIKKDETAINKSKSLIVNTLKAEVARQLWIERGYYFVQNSNDADVKKAIQELKR